VANNIPSPYAGGGGTVTSVTAADTSVVVTGTAAAPKLATGTLDVIAADHPPAAAWSNNSQKITSLANAAAATDAAAFGQVLPLTGGTLTGSLTAAGFLSVSGNEPYIVAINTLSGALNGSSFALYNSISSLGNQGGIAAYAGILNAGSTEGYFNFNQLDYQGNYVASLVTWDFNAVTFTSWFPFIANSTIAATGLASFNGGTDTSGTAAASSPAFVSGTARQCSTTQDAVLYIAVQTSAALAVAIGPTSTPANTIMPSKSYALGMITLRVPKAWYVLITGTIADLTITQVTC
jgi:hypothetical protein